MFPLVSLRLLRSLRFTISVSMNIHSIACAFRERGLALVNIRIFTANIRIICNTYYVCINENVLKNVCHNSFYAKDSFKNLMKKILVELEKCINQFQLIIKRINHLRVFEWLDGHLGSNIMGVRVRVGTIISWT